jgi:hypothetical protein
MAYITILCVTFITVIDGIVLVQTTGSALTIFWTYVGRLQASVIIFGSLLHAHVHGDDPTHCIHRLVGYTFFTFMWTVTVALSALPILLDMSTAASLTVLTHIATSIVYGLVAGCLLWTAMYFMRLEPGKTACSQYGYFVGWVMAAAIGGVVSLFV